MNNYNSEQSNIPSPNVKFYIDDKISKNALKINDKNITNIKKPIVNTNNNVVQRNLTYDINKQAYISPINENEIQIEDQINKTNYDNLYSSEAVTTKIYYPSNYDYTNLSSEAFDTNTAFNNSTNQANNFNSYDIKYKPVNKNSNYSNYPNNSKNVLNNYDYNYEFPSTNINLPQKGVYQDNLKKPSKNVNMKIYNYPQFHKRIQNKIPIFDNQMKNIYPSPLNNYSCISPPYGNYQNLKTMPPKLYYLVEKNDSSCCLKNGIDCALNACKLKNTDQHLPKYEYIVKGHGPVYNPYIDFGNTNKVDIFKRLTLKVGTCLDDFVNSLLQTLKSNMDNINKNNEVNLYDLYPFYNPDPVYTRPERPTLKTGNQFIDKLNIALDGTTLDKHNKLPANNLRIPVPKTEKTGYSIIDGVNYLLDNFLNEPISYHKYDYFNDKTEIAKEKKYDNA